MDGGPYLQALQIGKDANHHGLNNICIDIDSTSSTPMLAGCKVLTAEDVSKALEVKGEDPHCKDNVVVSPIWCPHMFLTSKDY